jgi:sulfide:quinone oxidoreductase
MSSSENKPDHGRRNFLLGSAAMAATLAGLETAAASMSSDKNVHVVIVGSGSAGISLANRLSRALPNGKVTVIDRKEPHTYWPGLTLVATGLWPKDKVVLANADFLPSNITWIKEMVTGFDPENNTVITDSGQKVKYDFMVVAMGIEYNYGAIQGMDVEAIGTNGLASVYHSPDKAAQSWVAIQKYSVEGGNGIFTLPPTAIRCAGAPLKMTFLTLDRLKQNGGFEKAKMNFYSSTGGVFGLPWFNDFVIKRFGENGMDVKFKTQLKAVDIGARKATFATENGDIEAQYELLHVVPPMRAPQPVRESVLAWQDGSFKGWLAVDKETLRHMDHPNVFGCGDVNGTPLGKTAATVKLSVPVVVANLLSVIDGKDPQVKFNGYTSCPLITRFGSAMLIEFDYKKELIPTFSFIDPKQESWFAWVMKEQMLKPTYLEMLQGHV